MGFTGLMEVRILLLCLKQFAEKGPGVCRTDALRFEMFTGKAKVAAPIYVVLA